MVYKSYRYYCFACNLIIRGSMGVASHRAGKKHIANNREAQRLGRPRGIYRNDQARYLTGKPEGD